MINLLRFPFVLGVLILSLGINSCPAEPGRAVALVKAEPGSTDQTNLFGVSLLVKLMADRNQENIVVSPFSLELALGMVYAGCSGTSADELRRVVGFGPQTDSREGFSQEWRSIPLSLLR
jgi:hypothetical protein